MRRFSTYVDNTYLPLFVSFYNSYKYYGHKTPLHVYNYRELNTFNIQFLKKYVDVTYVDITKYEPFHVYVTGYIFKFVALLEHMVEEEIILDIDMNFLKNLDYLFGFITDGNLLLAREGEQWRNIFLSAWYQTEDKDAETIALREFLRPHFGDKADEITNDYNFPNYNAGLIGFSKSRHSELLKKAIDIVYDTPSQGKNHIITMEQTTLNLLVYLYDVQKFVLDQRSFMNTWNYHKSPAKSIHVEDGQLRVFNDDGSEVYIYHYTGGIGVQNESNDLTISARLFFLTNDYFKYNSGQFVATRKDVEQMWFNRHQSPITLVYDYFYNNGEMSCPKHYNRDFRQNISKLLKAIFNEEHHEESPMVIMLALMYDYNNELGYEIVGDCKYYKVLECLGIRTEKTNGLTIAIESEATVNLKQIHANEKDANLHDWFYNQKSKSGLSVIRECLNDVLITTDATKLSLF